jgi:hypothetical protein
MSSSTRSSRDFHPLEVNFAGVQLAQLAIGVLGVLVITAEYSTGMIRASFTAVPKRLPVLWGKAVVYAATTLALMVPAVLLSFVIVRRRICRSPSVRRSWPRRRGIISPPGSGSSCSAAMRRRQSPSPRSS